MTQKRKANKNKQIKRTMRVTTSNSLIARDFFRKIFL